MIILCLGIIFSILGLFFFRPLINPVSVMAGQWVAVGALQWAFTTRYSSISSASYLLLAVFMSFLTLGIYLCYKIIPRRVTEYRDTYRISKIIWLGFIVTLISTPLILLRIREIGQSGPTSSFFVNVRYLTSTGTVSLGIWPYIMLASLVLMGILGCIYYSGNRIARWPFYLVLLCVFAMHAAMLARGMMVSVIIVYILITYIYKRLSWPKIVLALLIPFLSFAVITLVLNKDSSTIAQTLADYFVPPIVAFDMSQAGGSGKFENYGSILFSISTFLNSFGFKIPLVNYVLPFVYTPVPTNLYTVMMPYYSYGGIFGVAGAALTIGLIHGLIWKKSVSNYIQWQVIYAFSFIALTSHFGSESYLTLFSYWVQVIFWSFALSPRRMVSATVQNNTKRNKKRLVFERSTI